MFGTSLCVPRQLTSKQWRPTRTHMQEATHTHTEKERERERDADILTNHFYAETWGWGCRQTLSPLAVLWLGCLDLRCCRSALIHQRSSTLWPRSLTAESARAPGPSGLCSVQTGRLSLGFCEPDYLFIQDQKTDTWLMGICVTLIFGSAHGNLSHWDLSICLFLSQS